MKLSASASAIGLSVAYLAAMAACSSAPPDSGTPTPSAGAPGAGAAAVAGGGSTSAGAGGTPATGAGAGGMAPAGGAPPTAGAAGAAGAAGGGTAGGTATGEGPCPAGVLGHCDAGVTAASYPTYADYTLALVEDFPAAMDLDMDPIFTWSDGSPADGQTAFRKNQIQFNNGKMIIKAEVNPGCPVSTFNPNSDMCVPSYTSYAEPKKPGTTGKVEKMGVWSGEFRTKYNNYRYGRYEAKFKTPMANPGHETDAAMAGGFLSTMFVFRSPKWAQWNEIDVELEGKIPGKIAGNMILVPTGSEGYPAGNASNFESTQGLPAGYNNTQEHVYAFTWTSTEVHWYVDGVETHMDNGTGKSKVPNVSAKIMMNLWFFNGDAFGVGANNKFPMQAEYEYFRFYKLNTEMVYPCSPTPACLKTTGGVGDYTTSGQNNPMETGYGT